jgi:hypothetical protein
LCRRLLAVTFDRRHNPRRRLGECQPPIDKGRVTRQVSLMKHYPRDAFAVSFLLASVLLVTRLGMSGPLIADASKQPYQWFKDFQPLIGAALAGIGLYIAWRNVSRRSINSEFRLA